MIFLVDFIREKLETFDMFKKLYEQTKNEQGCNIKEY